MANVVTLVSLAIVLAAAIADARSSATAKVASKAAARAWLRSHIRQPQQGDELGELMSFDPTAYSLVKTLLMKQSLGILDPHDPTASFKPQAQPPRAKKAVGAAAFAKLVSPTELDAAAEKREALQFLLGPNATVPQTRQIQSHINPYTEIIEASRKKPLLKRKSLRAPVSSPPGLAADLKRLRVMNGEAPEEVHHQLSTTAAPYDALMAWAGLHDPTQEEDAAKEELPEDQEELTPLPVVQFSDGDDGNGPPVDLAVVLRRLQAAYKAGRR